MKRTLWLLALVSAVLIGTTWLLNAQADDTYNFYFQKAPGPVTVNQGGAPSSNTGTPDVKVKGDAVVGTPPAQAASSAPAPGVDTPLGFHRLGILLGMAGSSFSGGGGDSNGYYYAPPTSNSGMINTTHFTGGVQYNFSDNFGLLGSVLYMKPETTTLHTKTGDVNAKSEGSPLDYSLQLVVTPLHLPIGASSRIGFSALLGGMTVPFHKSGYLTTGASDGTAPQIGHSGSLVWGGRIGLEISRLELGVSIQKIARFSSTMSAATLALNL